MILPGLQTADSSSDRDNDYFCEHELEFVGMTVPYSSSDDKSDDEDPCASLSFGEDSDLVGQANPEKSSSITGLHLQSDDTEPHDALLSLVSAHVSHTQYAKAGVSTATARIPSVCIGSGCSANSMNSSGV